MKSPVATFVDYVALAYHEAPDELLQRLAFEQLHRDECSAINFIDLVNHADIRMVQSRRGPCLAPKSLQRLRVIR